MIANDQFIVMITLLLLSEYFLLICCSFYIVFHREQHWWIASAKLDPPEGLCIFGVLSIYCYDCQFISLWIMFFIWCKFYFIWLAWNVMYAVSRLNIFIRSFL